MTIDDIYNTRPKFYKIMPSIGINRVNKIEIYQSEFLAELHPSGHKINDPSYYENIFKKIKKRDSNGNEYDQVVEIAIERVSIAMQQIILTKHLTHLCGKNIKFVYSGNDYTDTRKKLVQELKQGWIKKNMETAKYDFCKSVKATGDGAFCAVINNNKFSYRVFSALNGDRLHPIFGFDGKLERFGRSFMAFDYEVGEEVLFLELWDNKYFSRYRYSLANRNADQEGWEVQMPPTPHGFEEIPIVYKKVEKGACWSDVQDLIDKLEMALSQLFENNKSYAFRIMVIKGGFEIQGDLRGEARAIMMDDTEGSAGFMEKADASSSFDLQLEQTLKFILMGSFTVLPPEVKGGDLPGVTIKILYSPSVEQGINDKNEYNSSIDEMVSLFKHGYGLETGKMTEYNELDVRGDIEVYVHQNDAEIISNLNTSVIDGTLSVETAAERHPYSSSDEFSRLLNQQRQELTGTGGVEEYKGEGTNSGDNLYNQQQAQTK
ncbi:phage portal protein [Parabacteroides sp. APC149_11_2_Y6]